MKKTIFMNRDGGAMISVTQLAETLRQIVEEEANCKSRLSSRQDCGIKYGIRFR